VTDLEFSDSLLIARRPDELYALVSDVTRMGEWSPVCRQCWWDEGAGPEVGAWFTGRNQTPERVWETRSQVVAAEPGRLGSQAESEIAKRSEAAKTGIPATLAAIKKTAESS
jgi:hypothetical protein